jgi:hypothetical protein
MRGIRLVSFALKTAWVLRAVAGKVGAEAERTSASARAWIDLLVSETPANTIFA